MVKQYSQAFTLCEFLIIILIIGVSAKVSLSYSVEMKEEPNLLEYQLSAMESMTSVMIKPNMWFNANGNINKGGTIQIDHYLCVVQLGFGRYRCE